MLWMADVQALAVDVSGFLCLVVYICSSLACLGSWCCLVHAIFGVVKVVVLVCSCYNESVVTSSTLYSLSS